MSLDVQVICTLACIILFDFNVCVVIVINSTRRFTKRLYSIFAAGKLMHYNLHIHMHDMACTSNVNSYLTYNCPMASVSILSSNSCHSSRGPVSLVFMSLSPPPHVGPAAVEVASYWELLQHPPSGAERMETKHYIATVRSYKLYGTRISAGAQLDYLECSQDR